MVSTPRVEFQPPPVSCASELEEARAELAALRNIAGGVGGTPAPMTPRTPRSSASTPRSARSLSSRASSSVPPSTAASTAIAQLQRNVPLVDEGGKLTPLTEWLVARLLRHGDTGSVTPVLALRTALQSLDSDGTGSVTPEQVAYGLPIPPRSVALGQLARLDPMGSPRMEFGRAKAFVGLEELRKCFARWNGGGRGRKLRYAAGDFRAVRRMLDQDYPRNRHPLGKTCDAKGRLIPDIAAVGQDFDAELKQRRFHEQYYAARHDAVRPPAPLPPLPKLPKSSGSRS